MIHPTLKGKAQALWQGIRTRTSGYGYYGDHYKKVGCQMTRSDFVKFLLESKEFADLYSRWKKSGFKTDYAPSIDRIDNSKGYLPGNIRVVPFYVNRGRKTKASDELFVRLVAWVRKDQKTKAQKRAKVDKCSESAIIRLVLDNKIQL